MTSTESTICPVTGLTEEEQVALNKSWKIMTGKTAESFKAAGVNMLLWMFDNVPGVKNQFTGAFTNSKSTSLVGDEMFLAHVQSIMLALDTIIINLANPTKTEQKLLNLAVVHLKQKPPIGTEYFKPFAEHYHEYVEDTLHLNSTHKAVRAWKKLFVSMNDFILSQAAIEERKPVYMATPKKKRHCTVL
ncbi:hypothetical protein RRG08_003085 [Elysia crispata]|uniref:Globin n=1 Tax=Elysia crispata TaxID=231223 RepID=A0AAE1B6C7_9GAST|nr:hypothetical protein RRG08_003085 [Elysia crispata]